MSKYISFPHPVLGNNDDIYGDFDVEFDVSRDAITNVKCTFKLSHLTLENLIHSNQACYAVRVHCARTFFRDCRQSTDTSFVWTLPSDQFRGLVSIAVFVVAIVDIPEYRPHGLNQDYGSAEFEISAGQVLAIGPQCSFIAEMEYDPLRNPSASIILIKRGEFEEGPFSVVYFSQRITVVLSINDWRRYHAIVGTVPNSMMTTIALPVLAEAIRKVNKSGAEEDFDHYLWYSRLRMVMERLGITEDSDPLDAAQSILKSPIRSTLSELEQQLHGVGE